MNVKKVAFAACAVAVSSQSVWAVSAGDAAKLGQELTAVGAEKAGSKDGKIPAFEGASKPVGAWSYGKNRQDFWAHKDEKPLFVIDASNVDKYAANLTAGQIQMLKTVKGYTMPVYPTHRECGVPAEVAANTKAGATTSSIGSDGWSLKNATLPGIPFPIPENGIQVMWNHLTRYSGQGFDMEDSRTYVSPRAGSTTPILARWSSLVYYPWARKGAHNPTEDGGLLQGYFYAYKEPAALAGQATMQRYYFGKDLDTYYYFTGQRRVRRLPAYSYDAPLIGFENQLTADMTYVFGGNPDRFNWKLIGKKEIYIPYNAFAFQNTKTKVADAMMPSFVNPAYRRYELHRVWEVEGTVKPGMRHTMPKKTIYVDEDSWAAAVGDDFDAQGKVWKVKEGHITPQWEIGACTTVTAVYNDVTSGRYVVDGIILEGKDMRSFSPADNDKRLKDSFFTDSNLGTISSHSVTD